MKRSENVLKWYLVSALLMFSLRLMDLIEAILGKDDDDNDRHPPDTCQPSSLPRWPRHPWAEEQAVLPPPSLRLGFLIS